MTMKTNSFQDNLTLDFQSSRKYTDEGYLIVPAKIGRIGVQQYTAAELGLTDRKPTEIVGVYRPPEEVFSEDTLSSFANKPVTDNHPPESVTAKNHKDYAVGFSRDSVVQNGSYMETVLVVSDNDAIEKIKTGKCQLSNGYTADMVPETGTADDGSYEFVQRNIRGNHIAIVDKGRAGSQCKISDKQGTKHMKKVIVDGISYEVEDQAADIISRINQELTDAKEDIISLSGQLADAEIGCDNLQAELDTIKDSQLSVEDIQLMVSDRQALIADAKTLAPDLEIADNSSTSEIKTAVLDSLGISVEDKSEAYVDARFDAQLESLTTIADDSGKVVPNITDGLKNQHKQIASKEIVDSRPLDVIARENMAKQSREAWKSQAS